MTNPASLHYDFISPQPIVFGWGRRCEAGKLARSLGKRAFLVWGSKTLAATGAQAEIYRSFSKGCGVEFCELAEISREPEVEDVDQVAARLCRQGAGTGDFVLAVG